MARGRKKKEKDEEQLLSEEVVVAQNEQLYINEKKEEFKPLSEEEQRIIKKEFIDKIEPLKQEEKIIVAPQIIDDYNIESKRIGEETKPEEHIKELKTLLPETIQINQKQLSEQAKKWKAYLPMQGLTPEKFLQKYPIHQSRKFIEEIIEFEKNNTR